MNFTADMKPVRTPFEQGVVASLAAGDFIRLTGSLYTGRDQTHRLLCGLLDDHDFAFYEYFLTDLVAHRGTWQDKLEQARRVESLVDEVLRRIDPSQHRLVVTSDHGNLEEGDHKRHTFNPVPLLAWGRDREQLLASIDEMTDVTSALVSA